MGKAPVVTDTSVAGLEADAQNRVDNGIPVIQPFPVWTDAEYVAAQTKVVNEYANVDANMFQAYFDATSAEGLHVGAGVTQDMYAELTKVLQAVLTDKDADVAELMKTANDNYQKLLDETYIK